MTTLFILLVAGILGHRLFRAYQTGLAWSVFALVLLSSYISISFGGTLPNLTVHRAILLAVIAGSFAANRWRGRIRPPYYSVLAAFALGNLASLVFAPDFQTGIKSFLSFTIEILLFFLIVSISLDSRQQAAGLLKAACWSLATVGLLAVIEKYTGFNPLDALLPGYVRPDLYKGDIMVTFPHRILLGTALAMGWPLALAFAQEPGKHAWAYWIALMLMLAGCYFSFSRGPWMAAIIGGAVMYFTAGKKVRSMSRTVVLLGVVVLIIRPGVWDTVHGRIEDTRNVNSFKGQTYQYRWELWGIAWKKISSEPLRTMVGFGPGATEHMAIETVLSYTGEVGKLWSWDNHYAATLVEGGLIGLGLLFLLYGTTVYGQWKLLRTARETDRTLQAAILSGMLGLVFMMSNVAIFAPQLNYLYWTLAASGTAIGAASASVRAKPAKKEATYA